jgi:hypothetical protein
MYIRYETMPIPQRRTRHTTQNFTREMKTSLLRPLTARLRAVHRAKLHLKPARSLVVRADSTDKPGSGAFVRGQAQFSRFYPPESRDFTYSRHVMLAVDGTHASEDAARWVIQNVVRSGDLLHLIHVAVPESFGASCRRRSLGETDANLL